MALSDSDLQELLAAHTEAWNRHDLESLMSLFAEDGVFDSSGARRYAAGGSRATRRSRGRLARFWNRCPTPSGAKDVITAWLPDYGVSEWTLTGTLRDGRRLEVNGCDFLTVRDRKIVRENSYRKQRPPIQE